jgi:hypothetical protein
MPAYTSPGLYLEEFHPSARKEVRTGVPVFLGYVRPEYMPKPEAPARPLAHWAHFEMHFGEPVAPGYLGYAVRGFFENGGTLCYVVPLRPSGNPDDDLKTALREADRLEEPDLLCAPDLMLTPSGQTLSTLDVIRRQAILLHPFPEVAEGIRQHRFVILDSIPGNDPIEERKHCADLRRAALVGGADEKTSLASAGLYYPCIAVPRLAPPGEPPAVGESVDTVMVPPCGHIAGVYARTDEDAGPRKAPANEVLYGVLDVQSQLSDEDQGSFFVAMDEEPPPGAVNCVRAFPGRGIRVWGARTLSRDADWRYINVRRVFLAAMRWIERRMDFVAFEANNPDLWQIIRRELNAYCFDLFQRGALKGADINEAFYVRCDESTNPRELRDDGIVVAEVGLAAARPYEFIVIRLIQKDGRIAITGANAASI